MKVIAFNGSARKDGNTATMVRWVFAELEKKKIETELYQMKGKKINGCIACYKCFENKTNTALSIKTSSMNVSIKCWLRMQSSWHPRSILPMSRPRSKP